MKRLHILFAALIIPTGNPDIEIMNFNLVESRLTARSMELQAQKAQLFQKDRMGLLHTVLAKVWSTQGSIYEIQTKVAALDTLKQDFRTEGATTITTPDAYRLETSNVTYRAETKRLSGNTDVKLAPLSEAQLSGGQNFSLQGVGLDIDLNRDLFRIQKSVRAVQKVSPQASLRISSQTFEFDSQASVARFLENVIVVHPQYRLRGKILDLNFTSSTQGARVLESMHLKASQNPESNDKINASIDTTQFISKGFRIVFSQDGTPSRSEATGEAVAKLDNGIILRAEKLYSFEENGIQKIRMEENVEIVTPTRTATCQEAIFTPSTGDFVLERIASLTDAEQTIRGEKIYFSTQTNVLRVEKATGKINRGTVEIPAE